MLRFVVVLLLLLAGCQNAPESNGFELLPDMPPEAAAVVFDLVKTSGHLYIEAAWVISADQAAAIRTHSVPRPTMGWCVVMNSSERSGWRFSVAIVCAPAAAGQLTCVPNTRQANCPLP